MDTRLPYIVVLFIDDLKKLAIIYDAENSLRLYLKGQKTTFPIFIIFYVYSVITFINVQIICFFVVIVGYLNRHKKGRPTYKVYVNIFSQQNTMLIFIKPFFKMFDEWNLSISENVH